MNSRVLQSLNVRFLFPVLLCLPGCTHLSTRLPDVPASVFSAEQVFQEKQIFDEIARHQARLQKLSFQILSANQDICKKTEPNIGAITHSLKSYSKKLRPAAERELGATDKPKVLFVRTGSPAEKAGLEPGDYLKDSNGKTLTLPGKKATEFLKAGGGFTRERGNETTLISFEPETQCDYPVHLKMSPAINAYANGKTIVVTAGMMDFAQSDDELALIIGHELAHNEMGHIRKIITNYALSLGATRYTRPFESEADYAGLYYMARAGFDIENVEDIWRRLAKTSAGPIARAKTHPTFPDRYVRLAAAREEIKTKRQAGTELVPNLKEDR